MMRATAAEAATPPRKAFSLVEIETAVRETELVQTDFFLEIFPEMSFQAWGIKRLFVTVTKSVKNTVFENHRKCLIQHCERSELRLHFEWTKVN